MNEVLIYLCRDTMGVCGIIFLALSNWHWKAASPVPDLQISSVCVYTQTP